jgi:hypothetical protein
MWLRQDRRRVCTRHFTDLAALSGSLVARSSHWPNNRDRYSSITGCVYHVCSSSMASCWLTIPDGNQFEEVAGQQDLGWGAEELCPGAGGALGCGVDVCVGEDLPDGGGGDLDAEDEEFAVDAAVAPARVFLGQAQYQDSDGSYGAGPARVFRSGHPGVASTE